jgi:rod shape determining protein RodA
MNHKPFFKNIGYMLAGLLPIMLAGLFTVNTFDSDNSRFLKQALFIAISLAVFFLASKLDYRFLRRSPIVVGLYASSLVLLLLLFILGHTVKGAQSWFEVGFFSFQPTDFAKFTLIIILAKYFSRRHVEIAYFKHILVSGVYAAIPFFLVLIQPDFGNAIIIFFIWLGDEIVSTRCQQ